MVVEGGQVKVLRHDVQLVFVQLRQQVLRQYQAVDVRRLEFQPHLPAPGADKADVELRVVRRQHPPVHELQKGRQRLLQGRRIRQHGVGDARQPDDLRRQPPAGVHEGLERLGDLSVLQHHRADLRDGLPRHLQARRLNVEAHDLVVKVLILRAVYGDPVVQIVDVVPLHAVQYLDLPLGCVPRLGERLHRAMVGNGDGRVSPCRRLLHHLAHVRQGVHAAHLGMQMQLHPLLRRVVLPSGVGGLHDVHRPQHDVPAVVGQLHLALYAQPHAVADGAAQHLGLLLVHGLAYRHGAVLIGDIEIQRPHALAPRLIALRLEYAPLHNGIPHLDIQLPYGRDLPGKGLAPYHTAVALLGAHPPEVQQHPPQVILLRQHLLQGVLRRLRQRLAALDLHLQRPRLPIQHTADGAGVVQQQPQLARRLKALKQCKKRYSFRHVYPLSPITASRSPGTARPPAAPAAPSAESCPWRTAVPRRGLRQCPRPRRRPRRGR